MAHRAHEQNEIDSAVAATAGTTKEVAVRCPLCDADNYRVRYDSTLTESIDPQRHYTSTSREFGRFGRIVECQSCEIVYMNPRPHHLAVQDAYSEVEDTRYLEEEGGRVLTFTESLNHIRRYVPSGKLLDVGCHVGTFLEIAERGGYEVTGVEPSRHGAAYAENRIDGTVHLGVIEDAPLPENCFDVITMWDVIEHLPDPSTTVGAVYAALKPGGIFAVTTMDVNALFPKIAGKRWPWYMQMHLVYFSKRTLGELLRRQGFEIVETSRHKRIVRVSYVVSRLGTYNKLAEKLAAKLTTRVAERTVGIDLGDIVTMIARKPDHK